MSRQSYIEARDAFLGSNSKPVAQPVLAGRSAIGWSLHCDGNVLPSARNDTRVFKTLGAIVTFLAENNIKSFEVSLP